MAMTEKPVVENCGCHAIGEGEFVMCEKHWNEAQREVARDFADGDAELERAIYNMLVGKFDR